MISVCASSTRRRISATTYATTSPTAMPPAADPTNSSPASTTEKLPPTAAATATRYATSAVASLTRLSPSITFTSRRGAPRRRMIAVAATGSVGETIAPSANAIGQERPITSCPSTATEPMVARTRPIESIEIARRSLRSARRSEKKAAA